MSILRQTFYCGKTSGRDVDKFKESGLTPAPAKKVKVPIIKECVAHLECNLLNQFEIGDHTLFVGEVIAAYANNGIFDKVFDVAKAKLVYHMGGNKFVTLQDEIMEV